MLVSPVPGGGPPPVQLGPPSFTCVSFGVAPPLEEQVEEPPCWAAAGAGRGCTLLDTNVASALLLCVCSPTDAAGVPFTGSTW